MHIYASVPKLLKCLPIRCRSRAEILLAYVEQLNKPCQVAAELLLAGC